MPQETRAAMSVPTQNPPLLLTKRLTSFLHANQTPQLPTLLLTTPTGKLLAHASPHPVSLLRTHATVAASLCAIHTSSSTALPSALPGSRTPDPIASSPIPGQDGDAEDGASADEQATEDGDGFYDDADGGEATRRLQELNINLPDPIKPSTITVQLTGGTVLIRRLKCGLLFVCVGPSPSESTSAAAAAAAAGSSNDHTNNLQHLHPPHHENGEAAATVSTSPSEIESLVSAGGQTATSMESASAAAVVSMRKHAAELARWLDDKLNSLAVPDEGFGGE
jgi:hypothetical protein